MSHTDSNIEIEKRKWANAMLSGNYTNAYSYNWGDPDSESATNSSHKILGNYRKIKNEYLIPNILDKTVLEIGALDGKWIARMQTAKKIICVDIIREGFEKIKLENVEFYLTSGNELSGIQTATIDFVFSIDSLIRSSPETIASYIQEIKRVLTTHGKACIHLPCYEKSMSAELGFTHLSLKDIHNICLQNKITNYEIDVTTINHGALLLIN